MALPTPSKDGALDSCAFALGPPNPHSSSHRSTTTGLLSGQAWAAPRGSNVPKIPWEDALQVGDEQGPSSAEDAGDELTEPGVRRDDPVPGLQSRHTAPDLQHLPDTFVPSHGRQRRQEGVGPCREAGGELETPSYPNIPTPGAISKPSETGAGL